MTHRDADPSNLMHYLCRVNNVRLFEEGSISYERERVLRAVQSPTSRPPTAPPPSAVGCTITIAIGATARSMATHPSAESSARTIS